MLLYCALSTEVHFDEGKRGHVWMDAPPRIFLENDQKHIPKSLDINIKWFTTTTFPTLEVPIACCCIISHFCKPKLVRMKL